MCGDCGYETDYWKKQEDYYEQKENKPEDVVDEFVIDFNLEEAPELQELEKENGLEK